MNENIDKVFLEPAPKGVNLWTDDVSIKDTKTPSFILNTDLRWN